PGRLQLIARSGQACRVDPVDPAGAGCAVGDQPGVLEHLQVLGYRGSADRQRFGKLTDGPRSLGQARDNGAPAGIPQSLPAVASLVSGHERKATAYGASSQGCAVDRG